MWCLSPRVPCEAGRVGRVTHRAERGDQKGTPVPGMRAAVGSGPQSPQVQLLGTRGAHYLHVATRRSPSCPCLSVTASGTTSVSPGPTRSGMWGSLQDGEKLGTGENLAPWHPIKPRRCAHPRAGAGESRRLATQHTAVSLLGPCPQPSACWTWPWSPRHDSQAGHRGPCGLAQAVLWPEG